MRKKIFILLTMGLIHLGALSALNYENELILLLDQVVKAKRYFTQLSYNPVRRILTRPLSSWVNERWKDEIPTKLADLEDLERTIGAELGRLIQGTAIEETAQKQFLATKQLELKTCTIPSLFARHWLGYSCGALALGALTLKARQILNSETMVTFHGPQELYYDVFNELSEKNCRFHATTDQHEQHYFRLDNNDYPNLHSILSKRNLIHTIEKRTPTLSDTKFNFYDVAGNNRFTLFFKQHVQDPISNLYYKIFKAPVKRSTLTYNIEGNTEKLKTLLEEVAQTALAEQNYDELFTPFEIKSRKLRPDRSLDDLRLLRDGIITAARQKGVITSLAYGLARDAFHGSSALVGASLSIPEEFRIQVAEVSTSLATVIEKQNLVIELIALLPAALLGYFAYKGGKGYASHRHSKNVLQPLEQDLRDFERLLDEYRMVKSPDVYFDGMQYYWTQKLESYTNSIAAQQRMNFSRDLQRLASDISPDHQLTIVTALLRYGLPFF